jgi:hypothetical protein
MGALKDRAAARHRAALPPKAKPKAPLTEEQRADQFRRLQRRAELNALERERLTRLENVNSWAEGKRKDIVAKYERGSRSE